MISKKFKPKRSFISFILVYTISSLSENWFVQSAVTGPTAFPERLSETDQPDLQRLTEDHRSFCRIKDSCNSTHWDWDPYCYCERCSCEPDCAINDNCCPEVLTDFWTNDYPKARLQCVSLSYRGFESVGNQLMIADCPASFIDTGVTKRCEVRYDTSEVTDILPIDDTANDETYANKYCAECHSFPFRKTDYWSASVQCNNTVFTPRSYETILSDINATLDCDVVLKPTKYRYDKTCRQLLSSCNETGLWQVFDSFTDQACRLYQSPYMKKYRNPFCAICNGYDVKRFKRDSSYCGIDIPQWTSFSALLDFSADQKDRQPTFVGKCMVDQVYDSFTDICRNLECGFGKVFVNGSCEKAFSKSRGLCYQFYIQLTPLDDVSTTLKHNRTKIVEPNYDPEALAVAFKQKVLTVAKKYKIDRYLRNSSFYETNKSSENSFERIFASLFFFMEFEVDDTAFLKDMNDLYEEKYISFSTGSNQTGPQRNFQINFVRLVQGSTRESLISPLTGKELMPYYTTAARRFMKVICAGQNVITVTPYHFHPYVRLDNSSYTWYINASGVTIVELNLFLHNAMFRETDNASVIFVSADSFRKAMKESQHTLSVNKTSSNIEGLITLILMSISTICLLITFLTYALFHVLRSQPGINNMILSTSLIIGYLLFLFGSNQINLDLGCKILGGMIHFSWLFIFFWMNVCSFHMFRVFGSLDKPTPSRSKTSFTAVYLLYSILSSSVIVGINLGATYSISNGKSYGYGSEKTKLCYIYEPIMTVYVMAIPAICTVIFNIVMFTVVVGRFKQITNVQKHVQNDQNYFVIYIKLSTLTGVSWILAIPMMLSEYVVFNYVFIVLTCSQGIYLMVAFICNKRVLKLYSGKYALAKASFRTRLSRYEIRTTITRNKSSSDTSDLVVVKSKTQLSSV